MKVGWEALGITVGFTLLAISISHRIDGREMEH